MPQLHGCAEQCPYCGETIELLIDDSEAEQDYIEDCEVCCQPISVQVRVNDDGEIALVLHTDRD